MSPASGQRSTATPSIGSKAQWTAFLEEPGVRPGLPKAIETQIAGKGPLPDAAAAPATTAAIATGTEPAAARAEAPESTEGAAGPPEPVTVSADASRQ